MKSCVNPHTHGKNNHGPRVVFISVFALHKKIWEPYGSLSETSAHCSTVGRKAYTMLRILRRIENRTEKKTLLYSNRNLRHKHLECCRQLGSSHFQSNRGELEKVLAQRRAKLRSEVQKDSCMRRNWINCNSCTWKEVAGTKGGGVWYNSTKSQRDY